MVEILNVIRALHDSWGVETSYDKLATPENMARGQCVVSSLIMQDYFGGDLRRMKVSGEGINETHYFNELADKTFIDTTGMQYDGMLVKFEAAPINLGEKYTSVREKLLNDDTRHRYLLLSDRVAKYLSKSVSTG